MKHTFVNLGRSHAKYNWAIKNVLFLILLYAAQHAAIAQSVVFRPDETFAELSAETSGLIFLINGNQTHWQKSPPTKRLSGLEKVILSLAVLRMQDDDLINLDTRLRDIEGLPKPSGLYADIPSLRDILTESAGFATPPTTGLPATAATNLSYQRFAQYLLTQRAPGKASSHDPVAWAYLEKFISHTTQQPLAEALQSLVFTPLGILVDDVKTTSQPFSGDQMPTSFALSASATKALLTGVVRNRTQSGSIFLKPNSYQALKAYQDPRIGPSYGFGFSKKQIAGLDVLTLSDTSNNALALVYIPRADTVFGTLDHQGSDSAFFDAASHFAAGVLPPQVNAQQTTTLKLIPSSDLSGQFVLANGTSAWLLDRLHTLAGPSLTVKKTGAGYSVQYDSNPVQTYLQAEPYHLKNDTAGVPDLKFSTYRNGGYVSVDDTLYRRVDSLLYAGRYAHYLPLALAIVFSGVLYIFQRQNRVRRNMAIAAMAGSLMASAGLFLDLAYWPHVLYGMDAPSLVIMWRVMLNIGAMLCLSMPLYALAATRPDTATGNSSHNPFVRLHTLMIAVSALFLTLLLSAFGVLGQFGAF